MRLFFHIPHTLTHTHNRAYVLHTTHTVNNVLLIMDFGRWWIFFHVEHRPLRLYRKQQHMFDVSMYPDNNYSVLIIIWCFVMLWNSWFFHEPLSPLPPSPPLPPPPQPPTPSSYHIDLFSLSLYLFAWLLQSTRLSEHRTWYIVKYELSRYRMKVQIIYHATHTHCSAHKEW